MEQTLMLQEEFVVLVLELNQFQKKQILDFLEKVFFFF